MKKAISVFGIALSLVSFAATQTSKEYVDLRDNEILSHAKEYTDDSVSGLAHDEDIPTKVSQLQNDAGYATEFVTNGLLDTANSYTDEEVRKALVEAKQYTDGATNGQSKVMSVNGRTGNVVLSSVDVHARPDNWTPSAEDVGAQPTLISGANIKTVNGNSLLGSGNIEIENGVDTNVVRDIVRPIVSGAANDATNYADSVGLAVGNAATNYANAVGLAVGTAATDYTASAVADATNGLRKVDGSARPLPRYLHALDFDDTYPEAAAEYYRSRVNGKVDGGCSAVRDGGYLYRNFDYPFDDRAEFVVKMSAGPGRFASVGVAQVGTNLTEDIVTSGKWSKWYKALPGATVDGINSEGVVAEINVVDGDPATSGWHTTGDIHPLAAVRWALDNATNAQHAATYLAANIRFPAGWTQNFHYMIADETSTYIVENGSAHAVTNGVPTMTNFKLYPARDTTGAGQERYDLLFDGAAITNAWYTRAYSRDTNPPWYSEFDSFNYEDMNRMYSAWESLQREAHRGESFAGTSWWQTVHTSVYDISNKTMRIAVQETDDWYTFALPSGGGGKVKSVNGKDGEVVLDAADVHALPDDYIFEEGDPFFTYWKGQYFTDETDDTPATFRGRSSSAGTLTSSISPSPGVPKISYAGGKWKLNNSDAQAPTQIATAADLSGYLPLTGGTLTGNLTLTSPYWAAPFLVGSLGTSGASVAFFPNDAHGGGFRIQTSGYSASEYLFPEGRGTLAFRDANSIAEGLYVATTNEEARVTICRELCELQKTEPHIAVIGGEYHIVTITETEEE